jgi:anti-sigma factor RsiW
MSECAKIKRILSRYIDMEVDDVQRAAIEEHLSGCAVCGRELSELMQVKGAVSGFERKTLPQDYLVRRIREKIMDERISKEKISLAGMGIFARRLIPVPIAAIVVSVLLLVVTSTQPVSGDSLEDHIFSGSAVTTQAALEVILGSQN